MDEKEKLMEEIHEATQYCLENRLVTPKMQTEAHKSKEGARKMIIHCLAVYRRMKELGKVMDDNYLNDFYKEWNERCLKADERMHSMPFTHEFLKAQSLRMNELVRKEKEELKKQRKNSSGNGQ